MSLRSLSPGSALSEWEIDKSTDSIFFTSYPEASVELIFEGTAVYVYGSVGCSLNITITTGGTELWERILVPPISGLLWEKQDLPQTEYDLSIVAGDTASADAPFVF
ncbi:hypothetical protein OBBRIDRAFT_334928 [Obba rivulosa]|uniref:Uncharacterized protein n=1 Tax=Obba rivulosa TaxID=1052685 RepID=A0A8E2AIH4_9APHY|nr:hypothetical protein OBBRIDRAFT_334928 [Obba rivulosa]